MLSSKDVKSLLLFGCIAFLLLLTVRLITNLLHRDLYFRFINYSFDVYLSIELIFFDISEQIIAFLLFRWEVAFALWIATAFFNCIIAKKKIRELFHQRYQKKTKKWETFPKKQKNYSFSEKDVHFSSVFGVYIKNTKYEFKWIEAHFCCLSLIWIPLLLNEIPYIQYAMPKLPVSTELLDYLSFLGTIATFYSIGLFTFNIPIRIENWKKIYCICFSIIAFFLTVLFVTIKCGIWNYL